MKRKQFFTNPGRKATAALLLLLLPLLFAQALLFSSCKKEKNREFDAEEVLAAAKDLVSASAFLNEVYYGAGIPYAEEDERNKGVYKIADEGYLAEHGIETLDALREKTKAVYSESLAEEIFSTKFSSVGDEDGIRVLSRYYQRYEDSKKTILAGIMVNSSATVFFTEAPVYHFDRMAVIGSEGEFVKLSLPVTVTDGENSAERTLTVSLLEEASGWRLASHTFAKYSKAAEEYEKLKNS